MESVDLNWVAVIASAFIVYVLGAIWYSPVIFARQWMQLIGVTEEQASGGGAPAALIVQAVVAVITAATTAVVVAWSHASGPIEGAGVGLLLSLGLIASDHLKLVVFEHRALPLFAINNAYTLIALVIIGAITATW